MSLPGVLLRWSIAAFLSLFPELWQAEEPDLGSDTQQTTSLAGSAPFSQHLPMSTAAAPTRAPPTPPHLLVILYEAADPLTLDLPFRLLQLLPPLLLLVLPVAVFFLPAIEASHRVGSGSLAQRINRFAHGGGDQDPRRPLTRDTLSLRYETEDAKTACAEPAGARARDREPAPGL